MCINCTGNKRGRWDMGQATRNTGTTKKMNGIAKWREQGTTKKEKEREEKRWWRCAFYRWISNRCHCNDVLLSRCSFHIIAFVRKLSNNLSFFKRQLLNMLSEYKLLSPERVHTQTHTQARSQCTQTKRFTERFAYRTCSHSSWVDVRVVCVT